MPGNDTGDPKNITDKTFDESSKAAGQSAEDAKRNILELLQKTLGAEQLSPERKSMKAPSEAPR
jgi:hypothetical protein